MLGYLLGCNADDFEVSKKARPVATWSIMQMTRPTVRSLNLAMSFGSLTTRNAKECNFWKPLIKMGMRAATRGNSDHNI